DQLLKEKEGAISQLLTCLKRPEDLSSPSTALPTPLPTLGENASYPSYGPLKLNVLNGGKKSGRYMASSSALFGSTRCDASPPLSSRTLRSGSALASTVLPELDCGQKHSA